MDISALVKTKSGFAQIRTVPDHVLFMVKVITLLLMVGDIVSAATANTLWHRYSQLFFNKGLKIILNQKGSFVRCIHNHQQYKYNTSMVGNNCSAVSYLMQFQNILMILINPFSECYKPIIYNVMNFFLIRCLQLEYKMIYLFNTNAKEHIRWLIIVSL